MKQFTLFNKLEENKNGKVKGILYLNKEDFIVQEVNSKGKFFSIDFEKLNLPDGERNPFVKCILVKDGISTFQAVSNLGKIMGIEKEKINYHGLKDTFGITSQEIGIPTENFLESFDKLKKKTNSFFIKQAIFSNEPCKLRDIEGNHFCIRIRDAEKDAMSKLSKLKLKNIPNYYGHQRFGVRQNTHLVGKELIKKNYKEALEMFCIESKNETNDIQEIRKKLKPLWEDWKKCLKQVANNDSLRNEIKIFEYLKENPNDYIGALNQTGLTLFSVNSYSSYLFNKVLIKILSRKIKIEFLPVIGYDTKFKSSEVEKEYRKLMAQENISIKDFFNKDYEELSYTGRDKKSNYNIKDYSVRKEGDCVILEFSLPMGVYANLFLNRIIENKSEETKLE